MLKLFRFSSSAAGSPGLLGRAFSLSRTKGIKKIERIEKDNKTVVIEGQYLDSEAVSGQKVLALGDEHEIYANDVRPCSWCELEKKGLYVQYTDVLILRQFLKEDGEPLSRKITGLCRKQQKKLVVLTKHARHSGLILNLQPRLIDGGQADSDPRNRAQHLKWNAYYDTYEIMRKKYKYL